MKPTAYGLFVVSMLLALSAALIFRSPNHPYASGTDGGPGEPWSPSTLMIALLAAAAGAATLGWAMLRYGGKGYTETNSPPRR